MAMDQFIKFTPDVKGEAQDTTYKGKIDVLGWSWGMSNSGSAQHGSGAGSGKVNVHDLTFTKYIDSATTPLMLACASGKHYDEALLIVRKAGDKPVEYLKIKMSEVLIASITSGGHGGEDKLTENVTLNFAKVNVDYTPQNKDGSAGTTISMGWDVAANTKI